MNDGLIAALDPERFQGVLESLPEGVFRAKGFLHLSGVESIHVFHLVGRRFTLEPVADAECCTRLVFIGTDFARDALVERLRACTVPGYVR